MTSRTGQLFIERRALISLAPCAALLLSSPALAQINTSTFDEFMSRAGELAAFLPAEDRRRQEIFLHALLARALAVSTFPIPQLFAMDPFVGVEIGPLARSPVFMAIAYRLTPGAVLPAHNHPNYSVATIGLDGDALVRHYEVDGRAPAFDSDEPFLVRETARRALRSGDVTTLTPDRDNIHTFEAGPYGARFLDPTTLHGEDAGFAYLDLQTIAAERYRAHWRQAQ